MPKITLIKTITKLLNIFTFINFVLFEVIIDIFGGTYSITFFSFTNREENDKFSLFEIYISRKFITFDFLFLNHAIVSIISMIFSMKKKN